MGDPSSSIATTWPLSALRPEPGSRIVCRAAEGGLRAPELDWIASVRRPEDSDRSPRQSAIVSPRAVAAVSMPASMK